MASIWSHANTLPDWCHVCGYRRHDLADIFYPNNAEHDKANSKYIRICTDCAKTILEVCEEGNEVETTTWHESSRRKE